VRLGRLPSVSETYTQEYYGRADKKFVGCFEGLSHQPPVLLRDAESRAAKLAAKEGRSPCVLDVGCGRGYLLKRLKKAGWLCAGIDIPGSPIPSNDSDLDCRTGDASKLPWSDGKFDLVVINHVLEHLEDPWLACLEAARVLKIGGVLYVCVPNFASLQRRLFGPYWFPLEIPRHLFHFTPASLFAVVSSAGFYPQRTSTWSLTQGTFGFVQSALNLVCTMRRNVLLSLLKGQGSESMPTVFLHSIGAFCLLPFGVLETVGSAAAFRGPIVAIVSTKS
jgi:2-polyprenyl-3-methyl-5-hydroxy-6-metoxy-1,4-benzoquinol methylase